MLTTTSAASVTTAPTIAVQVTARYQVPLCVYLGEASLANSCDMSASALSAVSTSRAGVEDCAPIVGRDDTIEEAGARVGGSALFVAIVCDATVGCAVPWTGVPLGSVDGMRLGKSVGVPVVGARVGSGPVVVWTAAAAVGSGPNVSSADKMAVGSGAIVVAAVVGEAVAAAVGTGVAATVG